MSGCWWRREGVSGFASLPVHPSTHPPICSSIHSHIPLFTHLSLYLSTHPSIYPFNHPPIHPSIRPLIHQSTKPSTKTTTNHHKPPKNSPKITQNPLQFTQKPPSIHPSSTFAGPVALRPWLLGPFILGLPCVVTFIHLHPEAPLYVRKMPHVAHCQYL